MYLDVYIFLIALDFPKLATEFKSSMAEQNNSNN